MNERDKLYLSLGIFTVVVQLAYLGWRYLLLLRAQPKIAGADILYQEYFASGASQKNLLTRIGGARNCLRLVVTNEILWVTSWFPFSLLSAIYDLEHVIPIRDIRSVEMVKSSGYETVHLTYADDRGKNHSLQLSPKHREAFLGALSIPPSAPSVK